MSAQTETAVTPAAGAAIPLAQPECFLLSISSEHFESALMVPNEMGAWVRYTDWKKAAERQDAPEHWSDEQVRTFVATALRHVEVSGELHCQDIRDAFRVMREQGQESCDV